jgi:dTDP-glucose 4,6-dehydratase
MAAAAAALNIDLRVLPRTTAMVESMTVADVRPPTVDDLLGREPVTIDLQSVSGYIRGRRVLVTGAGGSIGSELARQVALFQPDELFLLDRDESALHGLQLSMEGRALLDSDMLVVADIRDRERVFEVFDQCRPHVVFHAAALKHLSLLERHPVEGVKTNTIGTQNLLDAAQLHGVERFVNISTDKAAEPTSVLGATKLAAERLTAHAAADTGMPYLSVRFGNVLGSRGSVLPTFLKQIEAGGPVTVTDENATRFFMTIPEAVRLVVQAGAIGDPGEVLILDMGDPVRILDLAHQLINLLRPGTEIEITGLRRGEKLHEILVAEDEIGVARVHPLITHAAASLGDPLEALSVLDDRAQEVAVRLSAERVAR